jgi:hypothetical protein
MSVMVWVGGDFSSRLQAESDSIPVLRRPGGPPADRLQTLGVDARRDGMMELLRSTAEAAR